MTGDRDDASRVPVDQAVQGAAPASLWVLDLPEQVVDERGGAAVACREFAYRLAAAARRTGLGVVLMGFTLFGLSIILWDQVGPWHRMLGIAYKGRWFLGFSYAKKAT